jgi:catecholate siderophore receptor
LTGVLTLVNSLLPGSNSALAQEPSPTPPTTTGNPAPNSVSPRVLVTDTEGYDADSLPLRGYPEPLLDTPQSVTVVTPQLREDEAVTSFTDALRNVSGISIGAGEGSYQGDNYSIRGLAGRSNTYIDGMRDFGSYFRDPFDTENIEVLKGASSTEFGRGSAGGAVNLDSKQPEFTGFTAGSVLYGTNDTKRETLDFDTSIPEVPTAAFRFNLMDEDAGVADRDFIRYDRWGVAPSLAYGLGTGTRIFLDYLHQSEDDRPDYGIPYYFDQPAPVKLSNYYGFQDDYFHATVDIGTFIFEHDFGPDLTLHEQVRVASYHRGFRVTEADIPDNVTRQTPLSSIEIERSPIDGISTDRSVDEDINLTWRTKHSFVENTLVGGFEYVHQSSDPRRIEPSWTNVPSTSLLDPNDAATFSGNGFTATEVNGSLDAYSGYLMDTLKLGSQWSILGDVRYDAVYASYQESIAPTTAYEASAAMPTWRAALVFQPLPSGSVYFSAGTSFNPNAEQLAVENETTLPESFKNLPAGRNLDLEIGTKWNFLHNRLSFSSAAFFDQQTNAATEDADDDLLYVTAGKEHIPGVEFGLVGRVTDDWQVLVNYTYEHARVVSSSDPALVGNPVLNAPDNTASVWTTYNLPWKFQIGAGLNSVDSRVAAESPDAPGLPLRGAPGYTIFDAMVKYQFNHHIDLQMNVTNLANQSYFDGVHPGHVVPGEGRTFYFSTNFKF